MTANVAFTPRIIFSGILFFRENSQITLFLFSAVLWVLVVAAAVPASGEDSSGSWRWRGSERQ